MSEPRSLVVIPARYTSVRLPGKPLADIAGQPMVWHVYQRAVEAGVGPVVVATDDRRILEAVRSRGGLAELTSPSCRNGTERVAELARSRPDARLLINVQGDEPLIEPAVIRRLARRMADPAVPMGTAIAPLLDRAQLVDPAVVKARIDHRGRALDFWRVAPQAPAAESWVHVGLYAYRRETLLALVELPPSPRELERSLEQMRAMDHGLSIHTVRAEREWPSVDTPGELERVRRLVERRQERTGSDG